jgi:hypothetical protein
MNFFNWSPEADLYTIGLPFAVIILCYLVYLNSGSINKKFGILVTFLLIPFTAYYGYQMFPEAISHGLLGRSTLSPLWFKTVQCLMLFAPGLCFLISLIKNQRKPSKIALV